MSNVVQFLEALARNPKPLSPEEFVIAVLRAKLPSVIEKALLQRDVAALSQALDARGLMFCVVFPADNEEPKEGEEHQEDGGETPAEEPTSKAA